ncbi:MAG: hypothetical protein ACI8XB_001294 [Patiriisocius sp.]|jgi:hypothetical protein
MENKTGKYFKYAIGEILLVMVGILLALQVSNWNQARIASKKEHILLSELHQEFLENKIQFVKVVSKHQEAMDACDSLIAIFPVDVAKINSDSLSGMSLALKRRWTFNPSQGIINSLVSTSSFELITNRELRKLLVSWNDVLIDYQEDELHSKKYVMEVLNPFLNKHFQYPTKYNDPRANVEMLSSLEFENLIKQRKEYLIDILGRDRELSIIQETIDRIIELSKSNEQ